MLPVINLDTESYEEIFEKARRMISGICPQWTDYNEHDPGITFLQLFSWMKEMQQFHLDQIGKEHLAMYLKLLGMKQKEKAPAHALAEIQKIGNERVLPKGTRLAAGDITFETMREERIGKVEFLDCICRHGEEERTARAETLGFGGMSFYPFGEEPEIGNSFLLRFPKPLKAGRSYTFYFQIGEEYPVPRNPADENFCQLVQIRTETYGKRGFAPCTVKADRTDRLLRSGVWEICPEEAMEPMKDGAYGLRFTLAGGEYDVAPLIQAVTANVIEVSQRTTLADLEEFCLEAGPDGVFVWHADSRIFTEGKTDIYRKEGDRYISIPEEAAEIQKDRGGKQIRVRTDLAEGTPAVFCLAGYEEELFYRREYEGTGFPYQTIELNDPELLDGELELLAEEEGNPGVWEKWEKVDWFHCSGPSDRHYRLEEETKVLHFGDCEQGLAPAGRIRIVRYVRTLGTGGNVRKGQIRSFEDPGIQAVPVNREDAAGGRERESQEECFERFRQEFRNVHRAVTDQDYETLVYQTPGLRIARVKAVPAELMKRSDGSYAENCVSIVVQPYSYRKQARLPAAYVENIRKMLDEKRMLGTKVQILSPEYIGISVFADILVKPHYPGARERVAETVERYFAETVSGFGAVLEESELYGMLDTMECVEQIRNLALSAQGRGVHRTMNGNIRLPVNGLAYIKQADYTITAGRA